MQGTVSNQSDSLADQHLVEFLKAPTGKQYVFHTPKGRGWNTILNMRVKLSRTRKEARENSIPLMPYRLGVVEVREVLVDGQELDCCTIYNAAGRQMVFAKALKDTSQVLQQMAKGSEE